MLAFSIENFSFTYAGAEQAAVQGVSMAVPEGSFVLLCGPSGSGKSTLLRALKQEIRPVGSYTGGIRYFGQPMETLNRAAAAAEIGFVMQDPESQVVTDTVWHELAFGLENLGLPQETIARRVAETASYFGIAPWFRCKTNTLSGGQKQLLNIAAALVMQPRVIILDEPCAQLDPLAAGELLAALRRIHGELGITILLSEHRLEDVFGMATHVALMESGRLTGIEPPGCIRAQANHPLFESLPAGVKIFSVLEPQREVPLSIPQARERLVQYRKQQPLPPASGPVEVYGSREQEKEALLTAKELFFGYEKGQEDVLRDLTLALRRGEMFCLLGGNASGKTTLLHCLAGLQKPRRGKVRPAQKGRDLRILLLPQQPQSLFLKDTLREEFWDTLHPGQNLRAAFKDRAQLHREAALALPESAMALVRRFGLETLLHRHPFDLSPGEMHKAALLKLLLLEPDVLLLDEPTKGLDAAAKRIFADMLREQGQDLAILLVTHDVEFAAAYADRCALLFDGRIVSQGAPRHFFAENLYYTTAAHRIARGYFPDALMAEEVIACAQKTE